MVLSVTIIIIIIIITSSEKLQPKLSHTRTFLPWRFEMCDNSTSL